MDVPSAQGQAGWGLWSPVWWKGSLLTARQLELDGLEDPFQPKPLYESVILSLTMSEPAHSLPEIGEYASKCDAFA